jgi:hypothetical protein
VNTYEVGCHIEPDAEVSRRVIPLPPAAERLLRDVRANQSVERLRAGVHG